MKRNRPAPQDATRESSPLHPSGRIGLGGILFVTFLIVILAGLATPHRFVKLKAAQLAEHISNGRQVHLALETFAMDHQRTYPNAETARWHDLPAPKTSNDYFRQLFASDNTRSERIFWIQDHKLCSKTAPDDITSVAGEFRPGATIKPGDNGWAYVLGQEREEHPARPLLFDSPPAASGLIFDRDLWEGNAVVVRIDGSARPERLTSDGRLLDGDGIELLTPASAVWDGTPVEIAYPEPAPK